LDNRADLYSLTVMLYEMLLGRLPFVNERSKIMISLGHAKQPPPKPTSINAAFPLPLEAFLLKGLEKDPNDRYQSAPNLMAAYENALAEISDDERNTAY
jgi:serine/threonine protein kinase